MKSQPQLQQPLFCTQRRHQRLQPLMPLSVLLFSFFVHLFLSCYIHFSSLLLCNHVTTFKTTPCDKIFQKVYITDGLLKSKP